MSLTVWLLRHGELPQRTPRRFVGQMDIPLSERGRGQARTWAARLAGAPFGAAACSDLSRCRETASLILAGRDLAPTVEPEFREINLGAWQGLTADEVAARFPGQHEARGRDLAEFRPEGGESFADVQKRAVAALSRLAGPLSGHLLVVAHGGVNRAILCHVLGLPLERLFSLGQDYAGLSVLRRRRERFEVLALNIPPDEPARSFLD